MANPFFNDDYPSRGERIQEANKQAQAGAERSQDDADRRNGALIRTDALLARLMAAYDKCDEANRAEVVRLAEVACTAPGGII